MKLHAGKPFHRLMRIRGDVIGHMRIKFVAVSMAILIGVFIIMLSVINMIMQTVSQSQSMNLLVKIAESDRYDTPYAPADNAPPPPPDQDSTEVQAMANFLDGGFISLARGEEGSWGEGHGGMQPPGGGDWGEGQFPERPTDHIFETRPPFEEPSGPYPWEEERPTPGEPEPSQPDSEILPSDTEAEQTKPPASQTTAPPETQAPQTETTPAEETQLPTDALTAPPTNDDATREPPPEKRDDYFPRDERPDKWNVTVVLDHFALLADHDGNFLGIRNTEDYTAEQAAELMNGIMSKDARQGMYGWLQYYVTEKEYGTLIVLTDKTSDQGILNNLFRTTVITGILMLIALLVLLIIFSEWITRPVQTAFERQKQFVSDAGHELKTPIAVLAANADVLQDEIGENKWLGYMQEQTSRMSILVGDLLRLARMDNPAQEYVFEDFSLSRAVAATTLPFESKAFEDHKNLELDIQPDVFYHGSEQHIRQLAAIFIDNAMKYSDEHGTIKVTLLKRGENAVLEFYNTGCEISSSETEKIFERFYRGDKARNAKTSGYGLGLAIAKSIMEIHGIRIRVTCEQGSWIRFLLTL